MKRGPIVALMAALFLCAMPGPAQARSAKRQAVKTAVHWTFQHGGKNPGADTIAWCSRAASRRFKCEAAWWGWDGSLLGADLRISADGKRILAARLDAYVVEGEDLTDDETAPKLTGE